MSVHRVKILIKNQLDAVISHFLSWNETLHVSDSSSVHHQEFFTVNIAMVPVPVAARSKARVCGCWPAEIVGSNPNGGMDVCLLLSVVSVCVLSGRGLCDELITHPEESYRLWCVLCVI